ncbi:MAG TPA: hypothetical protein ENJ65_00790 [Candidatus Tenderia electrophaga]|uniref:Cytochrome c assembly protein domain-containing protein n=1 Tax=Candidatus Tenderia electrophaga TaxID=1748243 RepID=A0A832N4Q0_9GAMM|nr:hypothetical protein [Candidatus Tenderia electrophaga]
MHTIVIGTLAILLYLIAATLLGIRLRNRITSPSSKWKGLAAAGIATLLHAWILGGLVFTSQGINLGVFNAISLVTWLISALLIGSAFKRPTENLGIIAFPVTALAVALQNTFTASHITETMNTTIEIHILISIAATSMLSIAAVQALLLTIQDRQLRNKRPGGFIRALPPLQAMERFLFQVIGLGFALQTLSLLSGFIFLESMFAQHLVHKTILSIVAWLVFATLLWGRRQFGWRGKTAIRWTLSGFGVLVLAYIGSKIVQELILN